MTVDAGFRPGPWYPRALSTNRKMTMAKRAREASQKDQVKAREDRRNERQARAAERRATGAVGAPMDEIRFGPDGLPLPSPDATGDLPEGGDGAPAATPDAPTAATDGDPPAP